MTVLAVTGLRALREPPRHEQAQPPGPAALATDKQRPAQ
jgi:hypothetical protein